MKTSIILAEFVIVGILAIYGINIIIYGDVINFNNYDSKDLSIINAILIGSLAYCIGFVINALAEKWFNGIRRSVEERKLAEYKEKFNEKFIIDRMRYMIYEYASESAIGRMEYHNSLLRISRCICLEAIIFSTAMFLILIRDSNWTHAQELSTLAFLSFAVISILAFVSPIEWNAKTKIAAIFCALLTNIIIIILPVSYSSAPNQKLFFTIFFCFSVLSFWAFIRRVEWFTKTTIYSFEALRRDDKWAIEGQDSLPNFVRPNPLSGSPEAKQISCSSHDAK